MKLLTQGIRDKLPALYATDGVDLEEKVIVCRFFSIVSNWVWYVFEGSPEGDDFRFFGWVHGFEKEMGYFMLHELEGIKGLGGIPGIERDIHFKSKKVKDLNLATRS